MEVIDGDTVHVWRGAGIEKLRLVCVDTEEKLTGRPRLSPSKPETVFGQETANWARGFLQELAPAGRPMVRLLFPDGRERRDAYGRLLCHLILPDGRDFNLLLVELGKSPYFNKYGNSSILHEEFVAAQRRAIQAQRGVWHPKTNVPKARGAPLARRPYSRLLPWWEARARALEDFEQLRRSDPERWVSAADGDGLARALARCEADPEHQVSVFGTIRNVFVEEDGSRSVVFWSSESKRNFRARVRAESWSADLQRWIRSSQAEFRQNHVTVEGRLRKGRRGIEAWVEEADRWQVFGPEPREPRGDEARHGSR